VGACNNHSTLAHSDPMNYFRQLCEELHNALAKYDSADPYHDHAELLCRARAALARFDHGDAERVAIITRLRELASAVTKGTEAVANEFTMSIPPRPCRDANG
jgi:hypothetical protein